MSRCLGCGVLLQSSNQDAVGYVPLGLVEEKGEVYCLRCHTLMHHNQAVIKMPAFNEQYYQKIARIKNEKAVVLLLIDCLDLYSGFIPDLTKYIGNNPVIILLTKIDLLPKQLKIERWVERCEQIGLDEQLNIQKVIPISAKLSLNMRRVVNSIGDLRGKYQYRFANVYVLGTANVGKSTFINALFKELGDNSHPELTVSEQNQTTLDLIKIPIEPKGFLFDTPGVVRLDNFGAHLNYESMRQVAPKRFLKVRTFQLYDDQTIFIGGLVRLDIPAGLVISLSFYVSNDLLVHRTKTIKADELFNTQLGKLLVPPFEEIEWAKNTQTLHFTYDGNEPADLMIAGMGFVHIVGNAREITCHVPEGISVNLVKGIF